MSYPRTCRGKHGPHTIEGPQDERVQANGRSTCRECYLRGNLAHVERYQATTKGILSRHRATTRKQMVRHEESLA